MGWFGSSGIIISHPWLHWIDFGRLISQSPLYLRAHPCHNLRTLSLFFSSSPTFFAFLSFPLFLFLEGIVVAAKFTRWWLYGWWWRRIYLCRDKVTKFPSQALASSECRCLCWEWYIISSITFAALWTHISPALSQALAALLSTGGSFSAHATGKHAP